MYVCYEIVVSTTSDLITGIGYDTGLGKYASPNPDLRCVKHTDRALALSSRRVHTDRALALSSRRVHTDRALALSSRRVHTSCNYLTDTCLKGGGGGRGEGGGGELVGGAAQYLDNMLCIIAI